MKICRRVPLLLSLVLAGCSTAPVSPPAARVPPDPFAALQKQMSAAQVRALVGAPAEIKPFKAEVPASEIWVYHRKVAQQDREVPIGSQEIPRMNHVTGQMGTANEPIYETQSFAIIETIELLMVEQRLIEWKSRRLTESRLQPH